MRMQFSRPAEALPTPLSRVIERGVKRGVERCLGHLRAHELGPTVVVTGSIHGNEPAGRQALCRVFEKLDRGGLLRGQLVGLTGNVQAMVRGCRFLERDLNRNWTGDYFEKLCNSSAKQLQAEDLEQRELLEEFIRVLRDCDRPAVFLDLHTSSGPGTPFVCMADVLRNRPFAFASKLPVVLGLEEAIEGSMLGYLCDHGHTGIAVEGGSHSDPLSVKRLESVIWVTLATAGLISPDHPEIRESRLALDGLRRGLPKVLEISHRHVVTKDDAFVMKPGFKSFQSITMGQVLAEDVRGDIQAPHSGFMLLPRYQSQGDDGFFIARAVAPKWLRLSGWLRRSRGDALIRYLPGVTRNPRQSDRLFVDPKIARFRVTELFHLFGYRKTIAIDNKQVFVRRRPDYFGIAPIEFPKRLPDRDGICSGT